MNLFKKTLIKKNYKYKLLDDGISKDDISKAKFVLDSKQITMASQTRKFEETFAKKMGVKHALMVNSGSSANLLAIFASGNPMANAATERPLSLSMFESTLPSVEASAATTWLAILGNPRSSTGAEATCWLPICCQICNC